MNLHVGDRVMRVKHYCGGTDYREVTVTSIFHVARLIRTSDRGLWRYEDGATVLKPARKNPPLGLELHLDMGEARAARERFKAPAEERERRITVYYWAVDGYRNTRTFKTLKNASKYARTRIGSAPSFGLGYAVSDDGVGTIRVDGAELKELFPNGG